ncbi:MAG: TetR/AcrR family transcriptional regulator [Alphaproteobacteria bacterium]
MARPRKSLAKKAAPTEAVEDGRKWRRRAEARPDELLDAALDEFIAKGFDSARVEDIAKRAGLSKGAVYLYFKSKEELLRALIEREVSPVLAQVGEMARTAENPRETLRMIGRFAGAAIAQARFMAIPLLVISISNRFPELVDFYRGEVATKAKSGVEALIKRGVKLGQFRKVDPHAGARALIGGVLFEALWAHVLRGPTSINTPGWLDSHVDIVLNGLEKR